MADSKAVVKSNSFSILGKANPISTPALFHQLQRGVVIAVLGPSQQAQLWNAKHNYRFQTRFG